MTVADAIQLAQNAIAASPGSSEAWHLLAYAHEREKDLESALLAASKAVELSPAEPALWFHRGWLYLKADAAEDCLNDMKQTIANSGSSGNSYYQETAQFLAAESLRRLGRYKEALAMCQYVRDDFALYVGKAVSKRELVQACCRGEE
jgi:tetratricopeptide (TPR) repeat protein